MQKSLYFSYPVRSLLRGGQRTILAIFCVAVGVMAVVALQLVGYMLQTSLSTNARDLNGGDISVTSSGLPLSKSDLSFFEQLKSAGTIADYSSITTVNGALSATATSLQAFTVEVVDPSRFPLSSAPSFVQPGNATLTQLLGNDRVVVTQNFLDKYQVHLGDSLTLYTKTGNGSGQMLSVKISGVIASSGTFASANNLLLIAAADYQATTPATPLSYSQVYISLANPARTDAAIKAITDHFPLVTTQTVADILNAEKSNLDMITKFLEITGLISLLIGGVGIINTMQVQLSRRKTEIAMLKTAGYHRKDLFLLFGLEAGLLGLIGGIIGSAAAIGVSAIVRVFIENLGTNITFVLDPWIIGSGVLTGCATALIFGLLPIAQAANVRPLHVVREQEAHSLGNMALTSVLLVVLSLLFCGMATVLLQNDVLLGVEATYGAFAFLLVLGSLFSLIILAVSKLPVPERLNFKQIALILPGLFASWLLYQVLPAFGLCLLAASLLGIVVVFLPRSWKVSMKMALRNLGRRRARTATTMVALFIGIFGIALVVGVGQDLETQITKSLAQSSPYNLVATTSGQDTSALRGQLTSIPGLNSSNSAPIARANPVAINGQSPAQALPGGSDRQAAVSFLSMVEGYNLARNMPAQTIFQGRNLTASDANTNNVLVSQILTNSGWLHVQLKVGDTITFARADGKSVKTVTIVGIISTGSSFATLGKVLGSDSLVSAFNTPAVPASTIFYMKVDPAKINQAENRLAQLVPNATVQDLTSAGTSFIRQLSSILEVLVAIASLSVMAAVIIIANAVALAMLERRRELGILKSVGYTSGTVLSEVLIENGITAALGAFTATLLAAGGVVLLGKFAFSSTTNLEPAVIFSLIAGSVVLAALTAILVAWKATRVRPLAVLRYE
ncbi:MAG TPA: FtsX-like permease family protein [Ktedonobacteraceae bacterium]